MTRLEREPALEALQGALRKVTHGEGRVALVYGEAGIGRTSLVDCFARTHRLSVSDGQTAASRGQRRAAWGQRVIAVPTPPSHR